MSMAHTLTLLARSGQVGEAATSPCIEGEAPAASPATTSSNVSQELRHPRLVATPGMIRSIQEARKAPAGGV
jgi:hypothetical protein